VLLRAADHALATADPPAKPPAEVPGNPPLPAADPSSARPAGQAPVPPADAPAALQAAFASAAPPAPLAAPRPAHTAPPPTPLPSAPLPEQTAPALVQAVSQTGANTVELVLTPEDLGKLRFELTQTGDQMRIHLIVERPETLDLLRRNADQLLSEFRQAGFAGATLSFGQGGQGAQHQPPAAQAPAAQTTTPAPPEHHAPAPMPQSSGGGLDLRL